MKDLIQKVQEIPISAKFSQEVTGEGKVTSLTLNPRYFFVHSENSTYKERVADNACFCIEVLDDNAYYSKSKPEYFSITRRYDVENLVLPVDLSPMLHNSRYNMQMLSMDNPYYVDFGSEEQFGISDNLTFKSTFLSHISVTEKQDGAVEIHIKSTTITFDLNQQKVTLVTENDLTYIGTTAKNSGYIRNNKTGMAGHEGEDVDNFFYNIFHSYLIRESNNDLKDYKPFNVFKALLSKHLLDSDYAYTINSSNYRFSNRIKKYCVQHKLKNKNSRTGGLLDDFMMF